MDRLDRKLLVELQRDSGRPLAAVAERVGLSLSSCHRRVKRLEAAGAIAGYGARLDARALGLELEVFVEITLGSQSREALDAFERAVRGADDILECKLTSGASDYIVRVLARGIDDYERIHRDTLARLPGVASLQSIFTLGTVKAWRGLPVPPDAGGTAGARDRPSRDRP